MIKREVEAVIKTASNPNAKRTIVVVKTLPEDRQKIIGKTARELKALTNERMADSKKRLMELSDDEWNELVNESSD